MQIAYTVTLTTTELELIREALGMHSLGQPLVKEITDILSSDTEPEGE